MDAQVTSNDFVSQLCVKLLEFFTIKLTTIIIYDRSMDPKPTDDVLPNEGLYLVLGDYC